MKPNCHFYRTDPFTNEADAKHLAGLEAELAGLTGPCSRAQARAQALAASGRNGVGKSIFLNLFADLSDPADAGGLPAKLQNIRETLTRYVSKPDRYGNLPKVTKADVDKVAGLNHQIENVEELIKAGKQAEAQKQLDAVWAWALLEPLTQTAAAR